MNNMVFSDTWATKPLMEVATLQRGYDLPVQDRTEGPHPIFAANGTVGFHGIAKCKGPGVVTGRSGTIGKVHYVENDYWPLNTSLYVKDFHGNDPKWVFYMLLNFGLERFSQGVGVPTLNRNLVHGEPVRVPPRSEQRRIAAILDKADALRTKRREALTQLGRLTRSIFVEMFGTDSPGYTSWPEVRLDDVADIVTGYPFRSEEYVQRSQDSIKLCRGTNVLPNRLDWSDTAYWPIDKLTGLDGFSLLAGDILIAMDRPWITEGFKICRVPEQDIPALLVQRVARLRGKNSLENSYLYALLSQPEFTMHCKPTETTVPHISPKDIRNFQFRLPPVESRQKFARLSDKLSAKINSHTAALAESELLFASIQQRAFLGEL